MPISNDKEFKKTLAALPIARQRQLAAAFARRVFGLSNDVRVKAALDAAQRADVTEVELSLVAQAAQSARVESFTQCGKDTGWMAQAGHFVAKAAVACVRAAEEGQNIAWDAAMQARLARTCQSVADGDGTDNSEAEAQYRILETFLTS
jgi:hypothetical protein